MSENVKNVSTKVDEMLHQLPIYYLRSKVTKDLYEIINKFLNEAESCVSLTDMRLFIVTTDDAALHEYDVGLYPINADIETRRARVMARLQGNGALTKKALEELISLYEKTGCIIDEKFDENTVIVAFNGRVGVPYNFNELIETIEELKPAHIKIEYVFTKNTWDDLKRKVSTWSSASNFTWDGIAYYDGRVWLRIDDDGNVYLSENKSNAYLVYVDGIPYARYI